MRNAFLSAKGFVPSDVTVLILAGGRGTRIAALVPTVPKPMVMVQGKPFLEWVVRAFVREKLCRYVLSIGHLADVIETWVQKRSPVDHETMICVREDIPLGTGGGVAACLPSIETKLTVVVNGDSLLLSGLTPALERMDTEQWDGLIMARALPDTGRYGRLEVSTDHLLQRFVEKQPGAGLINGGIYAFRTAWLADRLPQGAASMETEVIPRLLKEGARIGVVETTAPFIDIGTPETLGEAENFIHDNQEYFL